jgi:hypothetical protein
LLESLPPILRFRSRDQKSRLTLSHWPASDLGRQPCLLIMTYFTRKASKDYCLLSRKAYIAGLIGWAHVLDSAWLARELTRDRDPVHIQTSRLLMAAETAYTSSLMDAETDDSRESKLEITIEEDCVDGEVDEDNQLLLIAKINSLRAWHLNHYDPDFFPSVPHGHWNEKETRRLDAYLGWQYEGTRQVGLEKRSVITDLLNNDEFRLFARTAIDYYLEHHPSYKGWRVLNPMKLPVKR